MTDGMLHPGVGRDDEIAREPGPEEDHERREPVADSAEPFSPNEKEPQERRLEEEGEHALHRKRLADHAAGSLEKRAQLVPNWNSIGMPVTTPNAKLMPKICAQKRAASL